MKKRIFVVERRYAIAKKILCAVDWRYANEEKDLDVVGHVCRCRCKINIFILKEETGTSILFTFHGTPALLTPIRLQDVLGPSLCANAQSIKKSFNHF